MDYVISPQSIELPHTHLTDVKFTSIASGRAHSVVATSNECEYRRAANFI